MKVWANPTVEEMRISETACGGASFNNNDGCVWDTSIGGTAVTIHEYFPHSGEPSNCQNPDA